MASGALPPGLPSVEIDGEHLKLPRFRGVFGPQDDCGSAMAASIIVS